MPFINATKHACSCGCSSGRVHVVAKAQRRRLTKTPTVRGDGVEERYVNRIAHSYVRLVDAVFPEDLHRPFIRLLNEGQYEAAIDSLHWPDPNDDEAEGSKRWASWAATIQNTTEELLLDKANAELRKLKAPLRVRKAEKKTTGPKITVLPVNPGTMRWAETRGSSMIREVMQSQKAAVRSVIFGAVKRGSRGPHIAKRISRIVGLLEREALAVANFEAQMETAGLAQDVIDKRASRYSAKLLRKRGERIARSETIAAMSEGQRVGWKQAQEEGHLPDNVVRRWISAPESPNPNRPCAICTALGKADPVGLDEPWIVEVNGVVHHVMRAGGGEGGAHPHCRCTASLERGPEPQEVE